MILYSETLTREQVEQCAEKHGFCLYGASDFYGSRKRRMSLLLRPTDKTPDHLRARGQSGRRVWAVTWEAHYLFMADVFALDPSAQIRSSMEHWRSQKDFMARAERRAVAHA